MELFRAQERPSCELLPREKSLRPLKCRVPLCSVNSGVGSLVSCPSLRASGRRPPLLVAPVLALGTDFTPPCTSLRRIRGQRENSRDRCVAVIQAVRSLPKPGSKTANWRDSFLTRNSREL